MLNGRKKVFARFAGAVLLAASTLVASPAPAQTGGEGSEPDWYCCNVNGCGFYYMTGNGATCCFYAGYGWWADNGTWYLEPCTLPFYQAADEPVDRLSQDQSQAPRP